MIVSGGLALSEGRLPFGRRPSYTVRPRWCGDLSAHMPPRASLPATNRSKCRGRICKSCPFKSIDGEDHYPWTPRFPQEADHVNVDREGLCGDTIMDTEVVGETKIQRRLAAILAADIAGYSALMGADDEITVRDLKAHQSAILPIIPTFGGRVIDTAGDGILAEFSSILNALKCAVAIQEKMAERNAAVEPSRQMHFRIGINQGDVVFDDTRLYGDGVNVAARLEAIAEPGGICLSGKVFDEVRGKVEVQFTDIGEQQLKNIAEPVRAYRVGASLPGSQRLSRRSTEIETDTPIAASPVASRECGFGAGCCQRRWMVLSFQFQPDPRDRRNWEGER